MKDYEVCWIVFILSSLWKICGL